MNMHNKYRVSKQSRHSIYMDADTWNAIKAEAIRLDKSVSHIMKLAWQISQTKIGTIPSEQDALREWLV